MDVRVGLWRKLSAKELILLNCGLGEDSWESLGLQGDPTSPFWRRSALGFLWKEWCWSWNSSTLATGKTIALTRRTFVGKVMSLLFNMLSRLVITFLPRSKRLLISSNPNYFPNSPPLNTNILGSRVLLWVLRGHKYSIHNNHIQKIELSGR